MADLSRPRAARTVIEPRRTSGEKVISPRVFASIEEFVTSRIATQLDGKHYLVISRLAPIAKRAGMPSIAALAHALESGDHPDLEAEVLDAMTINETSFFRDVHPFESLAEQLLPDLLRRAGGERPLTIWNGACSSGQESLSLAITIHEHFPELARPEMTRILSTDVAPTMVRRTSEAVYSKFEVNRGLAPELLEKYFRPEGRNWVARSMLTDLIEVHQLNLIGPWAIVPRCDLVLLRNVLIYFTPKTKADILRRIRRQVLKPHGCLLLGTSESALRADAGFRSERFGKTTVFVGSTERLSD